MWTSAIKARYVVFARPAQSEQDDFCFPPATGTQGDGHRFGSSSASQGSGSPPGGWEQVGVGSQPGSPHLSSRFKPARGSRGKR